MASKRYAIIDIETTGGRADREKITEIAIVIHDGKEVLESFETLLNPECSIPYNITRLTGITNEMVADAPKFYEVAKQIVEMTKGAVFVAHNVRFDYSFIRAEFKRLGYTYSRRQLCTVRLSRKAFPGLRSYSLGKLIRHFGIKVKDRHRAMADTMATVELFEKILAKEMAATTIDGMINKGIKESLLPASITLERLHALAEECGVYFLHNKNNEVIYVGKSINIKKRVMEHFADITEKASKLQHLVCDISYEITGSELVALLYESQLIKELRPSINRAQRQRHFPFMVHRYLNEEGYLCFDTAKNTAANRKRYQLVSEYPTINRAKGAIKRVMAEYELCAYYCNIEAGSRPCFNYHLKQCSGACIQKEDVIAYNQRAMQAVELLSTVFEEDFFIIDKGRTLTEKSVILVEDGAYRGYGFMEEEDFSGSIDQLRDTIQYFPSFPESNRLIRRFLYEKKGIKIVKFQKQDEFL